MSNPAAGPRLRDRLFAGLQWLLPQHLLSRIVHRITRLDAGPLHRAAISMFIRLFSVDMSSAAQRETTSFRSFNAFFTRALRPGARPLADPDHALVSPVDGRISQLGSVRQDRLLQAKGNLYELDELLGDAQVALEFSAGMFATIYLAPYDYHRIHMPADGRLRSMRFTPGRLFSVNASTVRAVPRLFVRNERVSCVFDGDRGPFAMVLVGALFVGSIETVWAGEVTPGGGREPGFWSYPAAGSGSVALARGAEMGRFNMGSTVILIDSLSEPRWRQELGPGSALRMGEALVKPAQAPSDSQ